MGIVILMWGSTIPFIFYGFYCDRKLQILYWSIVSSNSVDVFFLISLMYPLGFDVSGLLYCCDTYPAL